MLICGDVDMTNYSMKNIIDLGMKLAEGEGCIVNIEGAYVLLDYAKDYLSAEERKTYAGLKAVVEDDPKTDMKNALDILNEFAANNIASRGDYGNYDKYANVRTVKLTDPEKQLNDEFNAVLTAAGEENYGAVYAMLEKMLLNIYMGRGVSGNYNRGKTPQAIKFGNFLGCLFRRFEVVNSGFAGAMMNYIKKNSLNMPFQESSLASMLNGYINGKYYPQKEVRELIVGTFNEMNDTRVVNKVFKSKKGLRLEDFDLEPYDFFKTVFIKEEMTKEESDRFADK